MPLIPVEVSFEESLSASQLDPSPVKVTREIREASNLVEASLLDAVELLG